MFFLVRALEAFCVQEKGLIVSLFISFFIYLLIYLFIYLNVNIVLSLSRRKPLLWRSHRQTSYSKDHCKLTKFDSLFLRYIGSSTGYDAILHNRSYAWLKDSFSKRLLNFNVRRRLRRHQKARKASWKVSMTLGCFDTFGCNRMLYRQSWNLRFNS